MNLKSCFYNQFVLELFYLSYHISKIMKLFESRIYRNLHAIIFRLNKRFCLSRQNPIQDVQFGAIRGMLATCPTTRQVTASHPHKQGKTTLNYQ